jgi:hypothetical protein
MVNGQIDLGQHLGEHFTLAEFVTSQTAARHGLNNTPQAVHVERLRQLCATILEPAHAALGALHISSGYRAPAVNRLVGGSPTSAHMLGYAADVLPLQTPKLTFARWVAVNCKFDQIILEFGTADDPAWIHVSCDARLRGEILRADHEGYHPTRL